MKRVYFIDFDGTITIQDTCVAMADSFASPAWKEVEARWERREITTEECANLIFKLFDADMADLERLLAGIEIDPYFKDFLSLCQSRGERVFVLSDGYDFNIRFIFDRYGISLPYFANQLSYEGGFRVHCPFSSPNCGDCGTCKKELMEKLARPGEERVYIGDGYSDICPARFADRIYAKGTLYRYCREHSLPARHFSGFGDIIRDITAGGE